MSLRPMATVLVVLACTVLLAESLPVQDEVGGAVELLSEFESGPKSAVKAKLVVAQTKATRRKVKVKKYKTKVIKVKTALKTEEKKTMTVTKRKNYWKAKETGEHARNGELKSQVQKLIDQINAKKGSMKINANNESAMKA